MKALKILNIAFFAFILTFILQWFLPKPPVNQTISSWVALTIEQKSVVIPNIPKITIHNALNENFSLNTCEDLTIFKGSQKIVDIHEKYPDFCQTVSLEPHTMKWIHLDSLHKLLAAAPWEYNVFLKKDSIENTLSFSVEQPGFFRTLLSVLIYQPIYNLFVGLLMILPWHELGWSIVIVTIIIRLILLVPQHRMLENSRKLGLLAPKIKNLQEQYKDDKATLGMKMMELYKKEWVNPMGSCLPLLIQLPILTGLYWVISSIADVSNFYHLYQVFADFDPKNIQTIFFGQDLLQIGGTMGIIMMALLMLTQWLQAYLSVKNQPKSQQKNKESKNSENSDIPALDPQAMQAMMLYVFPIMIGVMAYFFPLGLGLYWWIGLLFMIVQQLYVNHKGSKEKLKGEIVRK